MEKVRMKASHPMRYTALASAVVIAVYIGTDTAFGADEVHDEIQVYNAEIAALGQWTYEQHLNYDAIGQTQPVVQGGFSSNRGRPAFTYRSPSMAMVNFCLTAQDPQPLCGSGRCQAKLLLWYQFRAWL
jgi:hypothetical protein